MPPEELRLHVGTNTTVSNFLAQGLNSSTRALEIFGEDPGGLILDWGCGSGRTARWLQAYPGWRENYVGCDVDAEAIAWLRQIGGFRVEVCGDIPPLPFDAATFSGVFAFSVLTHIPPERHRSWLEELARVLRPDALAYLTTLGRSVAEPRRTDLGKQALRDFDATGGLYLKRGKGHYKDAAIVTEKHMRDAAADLSR
jgi:SAM-dependent methyltransferase